MSSERINYDDGIPVSDLIEQALAVRRLLVKVIRLAALDWLSYKDQSGTVAVRRALDAYFWLFVECPEHPSWEERVTSGTEVTAFVNICQALDLDPETIRRGILCAPESNARALKREPAERERPLEFEQLYRGEVSLDRQDIYDMCVRADMDVDATDFSDCYREPY